MTMARMDNMTMLRIIFELAVGCRLKEHEANTPEYRQQFEEEQEALDLAEAILEGKASLAEGD